MDFSKSKMLNERFNSVIPGGSHTYAKGDDQYPEFSLPYIVRGEGCHIWDVDGNEFIEYGMGLRSVTLGHAYKPVVDAAYKQMLKGNNFIRPAAIEIECAGQLLSMIKGAEMVKFGKNGSDATTGAVRLSRAYTGRDMIAICGDHPFFSVDDWFIGTTPMSAGIPKAIQDLTVKFRYNDIESVKTLFQQYPGKIACVMLEPEKEQEPKDNFLHELQKLCNENGAVFILDEMITGFRWHNGGAQRVFDVVPDLTSFGKAIANGFSVAALVGKREIMQLGGLKHDRERVFLMSGTHGAETHGLAAALETMKIYEREPVIDTLWRRGERLARGIKKSIDENQLADYIPILGKPCCLVYGSKDHEKKPSQPFRTLLLQETMKRGVMAPSLIVSYSHTEADIDRTIEVFHEAFRIYRKALNEGIEKYLTGRPVKPVWRKFN
ncbi:MAG: glutamate-1-semialdehyde 2,1-aminomutase [Candidatus Loosdrechtia sp.]|uniref:glutamate-1-semialdehyde 2,1-aminomutase n=1 Tax=Candidatus Loosdrechtia sp. TaxID=3101272 RepID=UPI003A6B6D29|nr:MAG: glutamate-1-semialdehyde 2,1-aminomutase [Candidatus Jettenia sp. AMX2]